MYLLQSLFALILISSIKAQFHTSTPAISLGDEQLIWCTVSQEEQWKCGNLTKAINETGHIYGKVKFQLECKSGFNKDECMTLLDKEEAHITTLDAGEVFVGGRYHSLIPIMQEVLKDGSKHYYAVAVMKKNAHPEITHLAHLRGRKACFAGVGTMAGWVIPVDTLMRKGGMEVIDCNNHVKSAINFFGPSCAVNALINKYNPIGDNSYRMCELCIGRVPGEKCTSADPYAGFEGAFKCLLEKGDVAFLKHTTVSEMIEGKIDAYDLNKNDFELLCEDGTRAPVDNYQSCNWGLVPSNAVMTTSARSTGVRKLYIQFLIKTVQLFGGVVPPVQRNQDPNMLPSKDKPAFYYTDEVNFSPQQQNGNNGNNNDGNKPLYNGQEDFDIQFRQAYENMPFKLFESAPRYGNKHNLMFQDTADGLFPLEESKQTYSGYLGASLDQILNVRQCPVDRMTLCVTSDPEMEKCIKMRTALKAQLLKPEMSCHKAHSHVNCMQAIQSGLADVTVLDAGDVYTAGLQYALIPFISEIYNLGTPDYYVIAVAKEEDPSTELTYLRGKNTCHTGLFTAAGWIIPMAFLISNGWVRPYGCDSVRAAAEYFSKSCVPGALSAEYNLGLPYDNLCDLCHGASYRYCRRDASEDYYGYTGAFRCLIEGGGNVAFVKHTTVLENSDGKRREWWARNALKEDFELLCPDGTRALLPDYKRCNLGKVKSNAIVARGGDQYNLTQLNAYINLFVYAQQFYATKDVDDFSFSMFSSAAPYADLIFQDATRQLRVIKPELRWYSDYLGPDFMRARRIVDCHAGAAGLTSSWVTLVAALGFSICLVRGA
uniref:Serotransferrin n=1 Tax=Cacopsylla melanoneura TaxID=428564 RepID=A0A8D8LTG3_9HEMI